MQTAPWSTALTANAGPDSRAATTSAGSGSLLRILDRNRLASLGGPSVVAVSREALWWALRNLSDRSSGRSPRSEPRDDVDVDPLRWLLPPLLSLSLPLPLPLPLLLLLDRSTLPPLSSSSEEALLPTGRIGGT